MVINQKSEIHKRIIQNSKIKIHILYQNVENGLQRREAGKKEDGNIAFKCNWNDKNYQGICSNSAYRYNHIYTFRITPIFYGSFPILKVLEHNVIVLDNTSTPEG